MQYSILLRPVVPGHTNGPHIANCLNMHLQAVGNSLDDALDEMMKLLALNAKMANDANRSPLAGHPKVPAAIIQAAHEGAGTIVKVTVERKKKRQEALSLF